jgi:hypothetical protein
MLKLNNSLKIFLKNVILPPVSGGKNKKIKDK